MTIGVKVLDAEGATLLTTLTKSTGREWTDQYNDVGGGQVQIAEDDPDLAATAAMREPDGEPKYDLILRMEIDGEDLFAFILEGRKNPPAPSGEHTDRVWTLTGRGVLAVLERAQVRPEGAIGFSSPSQRIFGFMSSVYDDSAWTSAVQIQRRDNTSGPIVRYRSYPKLWPDGAAYFIWSSAPDGSGDSPVGTSFFRKSFSVASDTSAAIFISIDNKGRVFLDSEVIFDTLNDQSASWADLIRIDRILAAGTHEIAIEAHNDVGGSQNPGGVLCSILEIDDGVVTSTVILRTNNTWKALDYPATRPGLTPGAIGLAMLDEAQARGALSAVIPSFDASVDSHGTAWPSEIEIAFDVPTTSVLRAVQMLMQKDVDADVRSVDVAGEPKLIFDLYIFKMLGSDKTATVELIVGQNFENLDAGAEEDGGRAHLANVALVRLQDGSLIERTDAASLAAGHVRKETGIELGSAPSADEGNAVTDEILTDFGYPSLQLTGDVTASSEPYVGWGKGDTVLAPSQAAGVTKPTLVLSIKVAEDNAGNEIFTAQFSGPDTPSGS